MLHAGWDKCAIYDPDCPEWTEDQIQFEASADPVKAFGMGWKAIVTGKQIGRAHV